MIDHPGAGAIAGVVDASILVKLFLPEEGSDLATALVQGDSVRQTTMAVPDLAYGECANVFRTWVRRGLLTPDVARQSVADLVDLPLQRWPTRDLVEAAFDLALANDVTVYDATYLALADTLDVPLFTADASLGRKLGRPTEHVRVLGPSGWNSG
jgi:predicted nucleic acid-binding protein